MSVFWRVFYCFLASEIFQKIKIYDAIILKGTTGKKMKKISYLENSLENEKSTLGVAQTV